MKNIKNLRWIMVLLLVMTFAFVLVASFTTRSALAQAWEEYPLNEVDSGYQLTRLTWHVSGEVSGGGYSLSSPSSPSLRGNGCCCAFLPCVLNKK